MSRKARIAALIEGLGQQSPAGFAIALHIRFTTPTFMFQTYPKRWLHHYSASGLVLHDPVAKWGLQNVGHVRWSELKPIDTLGVLDGARAFGLANGAAVSVVIFGTRSIAGFARGDRDYTDGEMDDLEQGLSELHRETSGLNELSESDQRALTALSVKLTR